jgi:hypothetical protein
VSSNVAYNLGTIYMYGAQYFDYTEADYEDDSGNAYNVQLTNGGTYLMADFA